jgi:N-acyl-D-aspartate/D-glutamate deacylase
VISHFVRERRALTLENAIAKMSAIPAARCNLKDRGRLTVNGFADVLVFDPMRIADRATFEDPFQYPVGFRAVVVNGKVALDGDQRAPALTGRALRA